MYKQILAGAVAAVGMAALASPAHAVLTLTITDLDTGATTGVITDNVSASDLSPVVGHILFNGTVGQFFLGTESVLSNSTTPNLPKAHTDNIHVTDFQQDAGNANAQGQIQIVSQETYTIPDGALHITDDFSLSTNVFAGDGSIDYLVEIDLNDGNGFQTIHSGLAVLDTDDDNVSTTAFSNTTGTYTIRHTYVITAPTSSSGTGIDQEGSATNTTVIAVPEPATLGLLGAGLLGVAFMRRRRTA